MLLPTDLLPEKLGLVWGLPFEQPQPPDRSGGNNNVRWILTNRTFNGSEYGVSLDFDDLGLGCISAITHVSRDFWKREEGDIEAVGDEYQSICYSLVLGTSAVLGPPDLASQSSAWGSATTKIQEDDIETIFFLTILRAAQSTQNGLVEWTVQRQYGSAKRLVFRLG